jgi:hypothetical protein
MKLLQNHEIEYIIRNTELFGWIKDSARFGVVENNEVYIDFEVDDVYSRRIVDFHRKFDGPLHRGEWSYELAS